MQFEWDEHNEKKNWLGHQVSREEAEFAFNFGLFLGPITLGKEERFALIGKTQEERILFVVYTIRDGKIRIISVRDASRKERKAYEEKITKAASPQK